ncbi:hypothetical protein EV363DRAFT_1294080 [Boletus edulis]|nr:hypothetical protein EV363DRAFT_1294080 [Boletus edulis]
MVLDQLPLPAIANFASSSVTHRQGVAILFRGRLRTFANQFFAHPYLFMDALIGAQAVVSGSCALRIIFALETRGWEASDLDVYVPRGKVAIMTRFLLSAVYLAPTVHHAGHHAYDAILTVSTFMKNDHKVDIIESSNSSAVAPILAFHLTALMNYVTPLSVFSAYAGFTSRRHAVVNPMLFDRGHLTLPTCLALAKYRERGFDIRSTSHSYLHETRFLGERGHVCGRAQACAVTRRSTNDNYCVYISFGGQLYEECEYESPKVVDWCLGGRLCNLTLGYQTPYVMVQRSNM